MQSVHRYRSRLVGNSTQLVNQPRALPLECCIAAPQGKHRFATRLPEVLADADNGLSERIRALRADMPAESDELDEKFVAIDREPVV